MSTATAMRTVAIQTTRFGPIEVDEELIIELHRGMIGFEDCTRFVILHQDPNNVLRWLQSLDDGAVAFPVMDPRVYFPDYRPTIPQMDADEIGIDASTSALIFAVATIPRADPMGLTVNLLGPIVVNPETRRGKQVIVSDECYRTKHRLLHAQAAAIEK